MSKRFSRSERSVGEPSSVKDSDLLVIADVSNVPVKLNRWSEAK